MNVSSLRRPAALLASLALVASPIVLSACGAASAESISDTIKSVYNANSPANMDSITCDQDLEATVGATTTCKATVSLDDGSADETITVTAAEVSDGKITPTIQTTSIDSDAAFVAALVSAGLTEQGATVSEVTCEEGATVEDGQDPVEVACSVTATAPDGTDLPTDYTATVDSAAGVKYTATQ